MLARRMQYGSRSSHQHTVKVNHLSTEIRQLELEQLLDDTLNVYLCGLVDVHMIHGREENHAFVQTYSSESAQRIVNKLHGMKLKGMKVSAKLMSESPQIFRSASPPAEVQQHTLKVLNLPKHITEVQLKEMFQLSGKLTVCSVKINQTISEFNYAYVNYGSSEEALAAQRYFEKEPPWGISVRDHRSSSQGSFSGSINTPHAPLPTQGSFSATHSSRPMYRTPLPQGSFSRTRIESFRAPLSTQGSFGATHFNSSSRPLYRVPLPQGSFRGTRIRAPLTTQGSFSGAPYHSDGECGAPLGGGEAGAQVSPHHVQSTPKPCTVKVSIHTTGPISSLGITPQYLKTLFSPCGELKDTPSIRNGAPPFAYVNFHTPESAARAVHVLNNTTVKGVHIQVKLSGKQMSQEFKSEQLSIPCDDQLVLRLMFSVHRSELKKIADEHKVTVTPMKADAGINLTGCSPGLKLVESFVSELQKKVKDSISEDSFSLHCLNIPAFADFKLLEVLQKIEHVKSVVFSVVGESKDPIQLADFVKQVSAVVSACNAGDLLKLTSTPLQPLLSSSQSHAQQWFWQEDDGSFLPYTADICQKLNSSFAKDHFGQTTFKVGANEYTIDFWLMTQFNLSTNYERKVKRGNADHLSLWEYQNDQKVFTAYTQKQSAEIEKMFITKSSSTLTINGRCSYEFDFKKMRQVNVETRHCRHIRRKMASSSSTDTSIGQQELLFKVRGKHSSLKSATQELKSELARLVATLTHPLPQESDTSLEKCLIDMASKYCVKTEIVNHMDIQLEGVQGYVEKVKLKIADEILSYKERLLASKESKVLCRSSPPSNWEPQLDQVELKEVQSGTSEWKDIETKVHKTLPSANLVKLERIQNFWLWNKYSTAKQDMHERYRGDVNEKELFHGSGQTEPEKLYGSEKGFDFRFSRQGMWGRGTYFAVNASYSDGYAYNIGGQKQMLLAKVLTGETYCCGPDSTLTKPPEKPQHMWGKYKHALYDSVSGNTKGSDVFIIYDFEKAYPAYLITYSTTRAFMSIF